MSLACYNPKAVFLHSNDVIGQDLYSYRGARFVLWRGP